MEPGESSVFANLSREIIVGQKLSEFIRRCFGFQGKQLFADTSLFTSLIFFLVCRNIKL